MFGPTAPAPPPLAPRTPSAQKASRPWGPKVHPTIAPAPACAKAAWSRVKTHEAGPSRGAGPVAGTAPSPGAETGLSPGAERGPWATPAAEEPLPQQGARLASAAGRGKSMATAQVAKPNRTRRSPTEKGRWPDAGSSGTSAAAWAVESRNHTTCNGRSSCSPVRLPRHVSIPRRPGPVRPPAFAFGNSSQTASSHHGPVA